MGLGFLHISRFNPMEFFNEDNLDLDYREFKEVRNAYENRIRELRQSMPRRLYDFIQNVSLHDSKVLGITELSLPDIVFVCEGPRNIGPADSDLTCTILHFQNYYWKRSLSDRIVGSEILYTEIALGVERAWSLSILTNASVEAALEFDDFDFYVHDSRGRI